MKRHNYDTYCVAKKLLSRLPDQRFLHAESCRLLSMIEKVVSTFQINAKYYQNWTQTVTLRMLHVWTVEAQPGVVDDFLIQIMRFWIDFPMSIYPYEVVMISEIIVAKDCLTLSCIFFLLVKLAIMVYLFFLLISRPT